MISEKAIMKLNIDEQNYEIDNNNYVKYGIVPWDSEIFQYNIVEIIDLNVGDIINFGQLVSSVETFAKNADAKVICVKIPSQDTTLIQKMQKNGYIFVEEIIRPYLTNLQDNTIDFRQYVKIPLRSATKRDISKIKDIAKTAFEMDRFHLDDRFNNSKAGVRYAVWVENSFRLGEKIYVLDHEKGIIGFFILKIHNNNAYLVLAGIKNEFKGLGYGLNIYAGMLDILKEMEVTKVETTISLNNIPILNIYSKMGFKFKDIRVTLHKWFD